MTATYEPIASVTLTSNTATINFTSIPATYTDLVLIARTGNTTTDSDICIRFNNSSSNNYSSRFFFSSDGGISGAVNSSMNRMRIGRTAESFGPTIIHIFSYTNNKHKVVTSRSGNSFNTTSALYTFQYQGLSRDTTAVSEINILDDNNYSFLSGSMFSLYGIKAE